MHDPIVTWELIERLKSAKGGYTKEATSYLGVGWPLKRGWKRRILGKPRRPIHRKTAPIEWPMWH